MATSTKTRKSIALAVAWATADKVAKAAKSAASEARSALLGSFDGEAVFSVPSQGVEVVVSSRTRRSVDFGALVEAGVPAPVLEEVSAPSVVLEAFDLAVRQGRISPSQAEAATTVAEVRDVRTRRA